MTTPKYNPAVLNRPLEKEGFTLYLDDTKTFVVKYCPPGAIQVGVLLEVFINAFLPESFSPDVISRMTETEKLQKAYGELSKLKEESTSETDTEIENTIYTKLILKPGNPIRIEELIKDCFDLEARKLRNEILAQLVSKLVTHLSEIVAAGASNI